MDASDRGEGIGPSRPLFNNYRNASQSAKENALYMRHVTRHLRRIFRVLKLGAMPTCIYCVESTWPRVVVMFAYY
jgi:hypothetical protein